MGPNIGIFNSLIRITLGFTVLSWATAKLVRKPWSRMPMMVAMMGAMKIGSGILQFCPFTYVVQATDMSRCLTCFDYDDDDDYDYDDYEDETNPG